MAFSIKEKTLLAETQREILGDRTARRVFLVSGTDEYGAPPTLIDAEEVVANYVGSQLAEDTSRKTTTIAAKYIDQQRLDICEVAVEYSSRESSLNANPLDDDDIWNIDTEEWEEEYYLDATSGTPLKALLTNGKPITPRPKRKVIGYRLVIKKNVATSYSLSNFGTYNNRVNSDSVTYTPASLSWSAGQGHHVMQLSEPQERNGYDYRVLTHNVTIRQEGHRQTFDSRDKEQLVSGELKPIKDQYGREVDFAYPLAENGTKAATPSTAPFEITLKPYVEVAMNSFLNA